MSDQKNNASHLTVDEKILLSEYRKTGLTPKLIMTMKAQLDEKYTNLLVCKYWGAALKIHNINKLLHGDCSYCVHKEELKRGIMPCTVCYYLVGLDAQSDSWECEIDISEEWGGMMEKHDADMRRAVRK